MKENGSKFQIGFCSPTHIHPLTKPNSTFTCPPRFSAQKYKKAAVKTFKPMCSAKIPTSDPCAESISARTMYWVRKIVIGLGLCPFAEAAVDSGSVRLITSLATDEGKVVELVFEEIQLLLNTNSKAISTTLLAFPKFSANDFLRFNTLAIDIEEEISADDGLVDAVLIAAFHPLHQYGGMSFDDAVNFEKRAPYPVINILRAPLLDDYMEEGRTGSISGDNEQTLERIGSETLKNMYTLMP